MLKKLTFSEPFKITPGGLDYMKWLMGLEPEERKEYLAKQDLENIKIYFCKACHDSGFIYHPTQDRNDSNWGKSVLCPDCQGKGSNYSHGPDRRKWEMIFEHWFPTPGTDQAFKLAKSWSNPAEAPFIWLLIYGRNGCGKTHLARAAQEVLRKGGYKVAYIYAIQLFDNLRNGIAACTLEKQLDLYKQVDYLIIDDLVKDPTKPPPIFTDFEAEKLALIINYRYEGYLPTMITLNGNPDLLPGSIYSRFNDSERSRMCLLKAGDYRPKKG